ncbi:Uncharacterized membrane protein [Parapedobacter luteus]|uniref:Uncharacterized membrane protein n=1 Tax=Parapedobacter luteus TaxID=623280 RepID=A0A1T5BBZ6_9SPHI|nr:heparan-alpha-glucosaminide N-acetyltransferase domain-containing protein [Parapedobacter luteus]SKB44748.1 Uncharacterized membrane protein [Parapedobacter luteus]
MQTTPLQFSRIASIDIVRGLVMVIMALDHVRELIHVDSLTQDPTNLGTTTPAIFFTRWITHLCAPIFVFLAGTSAFLSAARSGDTQASRRFLISRGVWLLILEFTVVNFGIWFDIRFGVLLFQVIAAIGIGLVVLGLAIRVPAGVLGVAGLAIACLHNLLPPNVPLFSVNAIPLGTDTTLLIGYPPVPWLAIMLMGYGFGTLLQKTEDRAGLLLKLGAICLLAFTALRSVNGYGDPAPWSTQQDALFSVMSFLNVSKYPPSLQFDLLMLGIMFLLLSAAERMKGLIPRIVMVYGKVPLFYYLLHWYVIHLALFAVLFIQGFSTADFLFGFRFGRPEAPSGLPLAGVYLVWMGVVCVMYPLCRWYSRYKEEHRQNLWLRYI